MTGLRCKFSTKTRVVIYLWQTVGHIRRMNINEAGFNYANVRPLFIIIIMHDIIFIITFYIIITHFY